MSILRRRFPFLHAALLMSGLMIATPARADVVTDWNALTVGFVNAAARPNPTGIFDFAMVHIAIHDAVQAYQHRFETYGEPIVGATGSPVAAVASAARTVLLSRFPSQATAINNAYNSYLSSHSLLTTDPGVVVGQEAASHIIALRANDGSFPPNPEIFTGGTAPGEWRPTGPAFAPMAAPWAGEVTPFVLRDIDRLHEPGPPSLKSGLYAKEYDEVKALGRIDSTVRTSDQTHLALFYSGNFFAMMNGAARSVAIAHLTDIGDSARLLALTNVSSADALIAAWDNKRTYNFWRPSTAINEGDFDGNPKTEGDPTWQPLIPNPPYPDYTSGANSVTGAFMRTLELYFGDNVTFIMTTTVANEPPRVYNHFSDAAEDVVNARIYLGIHFRSADEVARRQAKQSADFAFAHILRPIE